MTSKAAEIPPELFPKIICNIFNVDGYLLPSSKYGADMENCSLVCLYWAQECRRVLFEDRPIRITSSKQAIGFRDLILAKGSKNLKPIAEM